MSETLVAEDGDRSTRRSPEAPLLDPLRIFLEAMHAASELEDFISDNARQLANVENAFVAEALRRLPADSEDQHRRAAEIIHRRIHMGMDASDERKKAGGTEEELKAAYTEQIDQMRSELEELTGRPEYYGRYAPVWRSVRTRPLGTRVLRASLLINVLGDFEVLVSALVRAQLAAKPEILRTDEQKYSMRDLESFKTLDEFREHCAERMADGLLRGGLDDWMDWFGKRHKLEVPGVTDCPTEFVEVFQRRHLLVHNGGVVNSLYLAKVKGLDDPPKPGTVLRVGRGYLLRAIRILMTAGVKLAVALARKYAPDDASRARVDHQLSNISYELLVRGHYQVVEEVNAWHLTFVETPSHRLVAMVNRWLARKQMHGLDAIRKEVAGWDTSTLAGRFNVVKLALLDEHEKAYDLVKNLLASHELSQDDWRGWPVLEGTRAYAASLGADASSEDTWPFEAPHADIVPQDSSGDLAASDESSGGGA